MSFLKGSKKSKVDLSTHGAYWSIPGGVYVDGEYQHDGLIWQGNLPPTDEEYKALWDGMRERPGLENKTDAELKENVAIDERSLVGRWHPDYSSFAHEHHQGHAQGGIGSFAYEHQIVGEQVKFAKKPIFYHTKDGELLHGIPKNGWHTGKHGDAYEGPEPGSDSEKRLGDKHYRWDRKKQYWVIGDKKGKPKGRVKVEHDRKGKRLHHRRRED